LETLSIRDLRGADLLDRARRGQTLAITNRGALIGVAIPVAAAWLEHLIDYNWSRVQQSVAEGEQAMASRKPMRVLDEVTGGGQPAGLRLHATVVGGVVAQPPESEEILRQIHEGFHPPGAATGQNPDPAQPSVHTVRMGDLSGHLIEQAGAAGQTLAVTHEGELVVIVVPVTKGLVQFLIEQNMSRVLENIEHGENQLGAAAGRMTTLDEALDQAASLDEVVDQATSAGDGTTAPARNRAERQP
jgi:antitoxin (DNA-binding transcriptional repressor) of toxin-antitoxin stability system